MNYTEEELYQTLIFIVFVAFILIYINIPSIAEILRDKFRNKAHEKISKKEIEEHKKAYEKKRQEELERRNREIKRIEEEKQRLADIKSSLEYVKLENDIKTSCDKYLKLIKTLSSSDKNANFSVIVTNNNVAIPLIQTHNKTKV